MASTFQSCRVLLALLGLWAASPSPALDLHQATELALQRDAALPAMAAERRALEELAVADAALPDPELLFGARGVPVDDPLDADMMTQYQLGLRQRLPNAEARRLAGERRLGQADLQVHAERLRRLEVRREVQQAWLEWTASRLRIDRLDEAARLLEEWVELTESRYRIGSGRQRDVDLARLELARLEQRRLEALASQARAATRLQRWTGRGPQAQAPASWPEWPALDALEALIDASEMHPRMELRRARIEIGHIEQAQARADYRPDWMIEAGYAHTRGRDPMTQRRQSDKFFAMVSVSLPLFTDSRQDRRLAAARERSREQSERLSLETQIVEGELRTEHAQFEHQRDVARLIEERILPQAHQTLESTLSAYRNDRASFDELIRAQLELLEREIDLIGARHAWQAARSELAYWTSEDLQ
ncbi:TolC family protein [Wenzhouxiangella marina]|uniref:Uncharacterized protein n=1 Tax=Wenzhouxiangella marina TaxID=1579979 RepID=A0A0K0XWJ8_9GAMM|nr:TolC family protein [Wenzhouxiangella marina]AKS42045.1 hypothetical protein WM2015_1675 [Wenzhouxiangella marina]MBB6086186.1 outer membrane protein TolC [Wenzhouxiangella marina]